MTSEERLSTIDSVSEHWQNGETQSSSSTEEIFINEDEVERLCMQVKDILYQIKNKNRRLLNNIIGYRDPYYEKLYTVYEEMESKKYLSDFWGECALRLQNALEQKNKESTEAVQLFTFFVIFAIRSLQEKSNTAILDFLAERCCSWSVARDNAVKRNCCMIVGYFFQYFPHIFGDTETLSITIRNDVKRLRNTFYKLFATFAKDQCDQVRNQMCISMEPIQDQDISSTFQLALKFTPKDYILNFLSDRSPIVRQTAVKSLTAIGHAKTCAIGLFSIAAEEIDLEVRKVAITKVAHFWPLEVSVEDRELILYNNLTLDNDLSEHLKKELLSIWLAQLAEHVSQHEEKDEEKDGVRRPGLPEAIHFLIGTFQWDKHDDKIMQICYGIYDVVRRLIHREKTVTLPEMINMLLDDEGDVVIISRFNRDVLLGDTLPYVFFWRAMIQYCYDMTITPNNRARDRNYEAEREFCLQKLAPSLKEMLNDLKCFASQKQDHFFMESAIINCIKICYCLDQDPCGLVALKELMEKFLLDKEMSEETILYIASKLMKEHYANDERTLLVHVLNYFSDLSHAEHDPEVIPISSDAASCAETPLVNLRPLLEDEVIIDDGSLASSFFKAEILFKSSPPRIPRPMKEITSPRMSADLKRRQIKVINAILKTGVFKEMNPYLTRLNEKLIPECIASQDDEISADALNVFTIISLINHRDIEGTAKLLYTAAGQYKRLPKSSTVALYGFVDLAVTFEKEVQEWLEDSGHEVIDIFTPLLLNENCPGELVFVAVEACAKLLLAKVNDSSDESSITNLASLMARCFHSSSARFPKTQSCIFQCFCVLKLRGRKQMQLLFNALLYLLNDIHGNEDDSFFKNVNAERAAAIVVSLSRGYRADDEFKTSLHAEQLEAIMEMVSRVTDSPRFVKIYCSIAYVLEIEDIDYDDLIRYINRAAYLQQDLGRRVDLDIDVQIDELDKLINHLNKRKSQMEDNKKRARRRHYNKSKLENPRYGTPSQASCGIRSQLPRSAKDSSPGIYSDWFI